jgi:hypothetical protein
MNGTEFEYWLKISCDFSLLPYKHWDDTRNEAITTSLHILPNTVFINHPSVHATYSELLDALMRLM